MPPSWCCCALYCVQCSATALYSYLASGPGKCNVANSCKPYTDLGNIAFIIQVRKDDGLVMMKYIDKETITGIKEFMKHRFDRKYIFCYLFIACALSMT